MAGFIIGYPGESNAVQQGYNGRVGSDKETSILPELMFFTLDESTTVSRYPG